MKKQITFTFDFSLFINQKYNVDTISDILNINPTKKWIKGDFIKNDLFRKESCWSIVSSEKNSLTFEEPFIEFFNQNHLNSPFLIKLINEESLKAQVDCIVKIYEGNTMPGIHVSRNTLAILSQIKCSIDFDIYDFRTE